MDKIHEKTVKYLLGLDLMLGYFNGADYTQGIELMFYWLHHTHSVVYTDFGSIAIMTHFAKAERYRIFRNLEVLYTVPRKPPIIRAIEQLYISKSSTKRGDINPLLLQLSLLYGKEIDYIISDNSFLHHLASLCGLENSIYTLDEFIDRCSADHREEDPLRGIKVTQRPLKTLNLGDPFFRIFLYDYPNFSSWFTQKGNDTVYVAFDSHKNLRALLKLKIETEREDYSDIVPTFKPARRLKVCSFKVDYQGERLVQRFLRIIFDEAKQEQVEEIYITIVKRTHQRRKLAQIMESWGFFLYGIKQDREEVYVRNMKRQCLGNPRLYYPEFDLNRDAVLLPIHESYARYLLPMINNGESNDDIEPYKNAINKIFVAGYDCPTINTGTTLLFLRYGNDTSPVIIGLGVAEDVAICPRTKEQMVQKCYKSSLLPKNQLQQLWRDDSPIHLIKFLHCLSFTPEISEKNTFLKTFIGVTSQALKLSPSETAQILNAITS